MSEMTMLSIILIKIMTMFAVPMLIIACTTQPSIKIFALQMSATNNQTMKNTNPTVNNTTTNANRTCTI